MSTVLIYKRLLYTLGLLVTFSVISVDLKNVKKFTLITFLYNETNEKRLNEYIFCIENNLQHPSIEKIHVIYDSSKTDESDQCLTYLHSKKISLSYVESRPTYHEAFKIANKSYPNSNIIISNADIYFDDTLFSVNNYDLEEKFLAITRWDLIKDKIIIPLLTDYGKQIDHSQDVWIFKTPLRPFKKDDILVGTLGCDRRIAYWAKESGLTVLNPCLTIQCIHIHFSNIRHYENIPPPQEYSMPVPWNKLD